MKKSFITVFCFVGILILNSCGGGTQSESNESESKIDTKILLQNKFEQTNDAFDYLLIFKEDKTYEVTYKGPSNTGLGSDIEGSDCFYVEGEYELKDVTILLHPKKYLDKPNGKAIEPSKAWGEATCTIVDKAFEQQYANGMTSTYTKHLLVNIPNVPKDFQEIQLGISGFLKSGQ